MSSQESTLKPGYGVLTYRYLVLGDQVKYCFFQLVDSEYATITPHEFHIHPICTYLSFDPTGHYYPGEAWRVTPATDSPLTDIEWVEHGQVAMEILAAWGGYQKFGELPFVDHFYRYTDLMEVSQEEAVQG